MGDTLHIEPGQALKKTRALSTTLILFGVLAAMVVVFSALSRDFYSFQNISTMLTNISFSGIVAGTLTLVMITGGPGHLHRRQHRPHLLPRRLPLQPHPSRSGLGPCPHRPGLGAAIGAFNGFFITRLDLNPIITTLGTMAVTRGLGVRSHQVAVHPDHGGRDRLHRQDADPRDPDPHPPCALRRHFRRPVLTC